AWLPTQARDSRIDHLVGIERDSDRVFAKLCDELTNQVDALRPVSPVCAIDHCVKRWITPPGPVATAIEERNDLRQRIQPDISVGLDKNRCDFVVFDVACEASIFVSANVHIQSDTAELRTDGERAFPVQRIAAR